MTPTVETTTLTSATFENLVREILVRLGEDPAREGLLRTPERVHHAFASENAVSGDELLYQVVELGHRSPHILVSTVQSAQNRGNSATSSLKQASGLPY